MNAPCSVTTTSTQHTIEVGIRLGRCAEPNDVIALSGALGAGKTQMAKGIAAGLQVGDTRIVNSPTFVIVNEYAGRLHMYHIDVYRLGSSAELLALGFDEMYTAGGVTVIEWADKVRDILPLDVLSIQMTATGDDSRNLLLTAGGSRSKQLLRQVLRTQNETTQRTHGTQA